MVKYTVFFTAAFMAILTATGCKKDDAMQQQASAKITQTTISGVNGPVAGTVGQQLTFNLLWQSTDSLARFNHLLDSTTEHTLHIKLFLISNTSATENTASTHINTIPYTFKASAAGTYYLKFYKQDNVGQTAIIDTVVIK